MSNLPALNSPSMWPLLGLLFVFFSWAAVELANCFLGARQLHQGAWRLKHDVAPEDSFPGAQPWQKRAVAVARRLRQPTGGYLSYPRHELDAIAAEILSPLARPRALSGLIIILGLLITLLNLRGAVEGMKTALEAPTETEYIPQDSNTSSAAASGKVARDERAARQEADAEVLRAQKTLQVSQGMEHIAGSASTAFGLSAMAIGLAAAVLFLSVITQRYASIALSEFGGWLFEHYDTALIRQTRQPVDTAVKLGRAAEVLAGVAASFEETNSALQEMKLFGSKIESAAQQISLAVANLPTQIDTSMTKISGNVAEGIKGGLEHQGQYLESLVAIYSDHATVVRKTIELLTQVSGANQAASDSLRGLSSLPANLLNVAQSAQQSTGVVQHLAAVVEALDKRVRALPAEQMASAAGQLTNAATRLVTLEDQISAMQEAATRLINSGADAQGHQGAELILAQLAQLEATLKSNVELSKETLLGELRIATRELEDRIPPPANQIGASVDQQLMSLYFMLKELERSIDSLPSRRLLSFYQSAKKMLIGG